MSDIKHIDWDRNEHVTGRTDGGDIVDEKYLITSKSLDFLDDKIVFEGLKVKL